MPKKPVKKSKKKNIKSKAKPVKIKVLKENLVGYVTHYFTKIKVAIIKFKKPVKVGDEIHLKGATTDFRQKISSMQFDHKEIKSAKPNKQVGIKAKKRVREGDMVYK